MYTNKHKLTQVGSPGRHFPQPGPEFAFFMHAFGKALEPKLRPRRINSMPHLNNKVRLAKIYGLGFETAFDAVWPRAFVFPAGL
jgi:hypothetical protein